MNTSRSPLPNLKCVVVVSSVVVGPDQEVRREAEAGQKDEAVVAMIDVRRKLPIRRFVPDHRHGERVVVEHVPGGVVLPEHV